jgi:hypothetical protein
LTKFQARAKRSWFTVRGSLRGTRSIGSLWIPATVSIEEDTVRVSTGDGVREFRPRGFIWNGPETIVVSGLDSRTHLTRVILKFGNSDDAHRASESLTKEGRATEKTLLSSDEIEAYTKFVIPKTTI